MKNIGVMSIGVKTPIIREGDDIASIVVDSVLDSIGGLNDKDVIGITESIVARSMGNYATIDEIANEIKTKLNNPKKIVVVNPIYSRNRFAMILKAIARAAEDTIKIYMPMFDEVGNPSGVNRFTGVDIMDYYRGIVESEGKHCEIMRTSSFDNREMLETPMIYCGLHDYAKWKEKYMRYSDDVKFFTLADFCDDKCEYGLLGSNKATEEKLKLFPNTEKAQKLVEDIQKTIFGKIGKKVEVMVYGDGCFKDPVGGIWEFADPVVSPAYTKGLEGTPNEIKIKAFADDQFGDLSGEALKNAITNKIANKDKNLVGNMASQGTTPRRLSFKMSNCLNGDKMDCLDLRYSTQCLEESSLSFATAIKLLC